MVDVTLGPQSVSNFIPGPSQAPEFKFLVGIGQLQASLEPPIFLQALDKGISVQENTVTIPEVELPMGLEGQQARQGKEENPAHWKIFPLGGD